MEYFNFIKPVVEYIERHLKQSLRPDDIAGIVGFSPSHLRMVFRAMTGESLACYIRRRRLCHAARELSTTDQRIIDIALQYQYGTHEAFSRAFKREFGVSPQQFREQRRVADVTLVVPGLYGPLVLDRKEQEHMSRDKRIEQGEGYRIIYGVPKVSYFDGKGEGTPFPASLKAVLNYLGQDERYDLLMAVSGAAFRLMWNVNYWDGGNVDILMMREDPIEPLKRALAAVGREFQMLCKPGDAGHSIAEVTRQPEVRSGDKNDFVHFVKAAIDSGRPLIGFGIIGPPEAGVIAGYRDDGDTLLGWNFFQEMPEYAGGLEQASNGYFVKSNWFEHNDTIALLSVGEQTGRPTTRELVTDTLAFALEVMETPQVNEHAGGSAAYEIWSEKLLDDKEFPPGAPLPMLFERLMCHSDALCMIGEGRWNAHLFLKWAAEELPEANAELQATAELFKRQHDLSYQMWDLLGGVGMQARQAQNLARKEVRTKSAALVKKTQQLNEEAAQQLKAALTKLG